MVLDEVTGSSPLPRLELIQRDYVIPKNMGYYESVRPVEEIFERDRGGIIISPKICERRMQHATDVHVISSNPRHDGSQHRTACVRPDDSSCRFILKKLGNGICPSGIESMLECMYLRTKSGLE